MNNYIEMAYKATANSTHPQHQVAAVVVRAGSVLSVEANLHQWGRCAERRALRPNVNYAGADLIVVRNNGKCSKPCAKCQVIIKKAGIRKVIYMNQAGDVKIEKPSSWKVDMKRKFVRSEQYD